MQRWPSPIKNLSAEDMRESISHCRLIVPTTSGREIPGKEPSTYFFGFFELLTSRSSSETSIHACSRFNDRLF